MDKDLEKKIEEAATKKYEKTRGSFSPGSKFLEKVFVEGAKSPEAKEYWQQGMYTEEEVKALFNNLFFSEIYPDHTINWEQEDLDLWFEQNKKK